MRARLIPRQNFPIWGWRVKDLKFHFTILRNYIFGFKTILIVRAPVNRRLFKYVKLIKNERVGANKSVPWDKNAGKGRPNFETNETVWDRGGEEERFGNNYFKNQFYREGKSKSLEMRKIKSRYGSVGGSMRWKKFLP